MKIMSDISCTILSPRTRILTFDDNISVLLIIGSRFTFLCDTHLGPESMKKVQNELGTISHPEQMVIFNSHSDWDHVWGNCEFSHNLIIGHSTCRDRLKERGEYDLISHSSMTRGIVTITLPNMTFDSRLTFEEDDVEFIYAPGHTIDSSLCFDRKDSILYVGDLVEDPIPYLDYERTDLYLNTLEMLLTFPADIMVSAHSGIIVRDLIRANIAYIQAVQEGKSIDNSRFGAYDNVHQLNLNTRIMFCYEKEVRDILKEKFDFLSFWSLFPNFEKKSSDELEINLKQYLMEIEKVRHHQ